MWPFKKKQNVIDQHARTVLRLTDEKSARLGSEYLETIRHLHGEGMYNKVVQRVMQLDMQDTLTELQEMRFNNGSRR